jgi:hypothetical protein
VSQFESGALDATFALAEMIDATPPKPGKRGPYRRRRPQPEIFKVRLTCGNPSWSTRAIHMGFEAVQPLGGRRKASLLCARMAKYIAAAPTNGFAVEQVTQGQLYPEAEVAQFLD